MGRGYIFLLGLVVLLDELPVLNVVSQTISRHILNFDLNLLFI